MSRDAHRLLRDRDDWAFCLRQGLPAFFSATYEAALRDLAASIIGRGC